MSEPVSKLQADVEAGKFVVTAEIGPPKGINMGPVMEAMFGRWTWVAIEGYKEEDRRKPVHLR